MVVYIATVDGAVLCSATYCDTASEKAGKVEEGVCRRSAAVVDAARAVDVRVLRGLARRASWYCSCHSCTGMNAHRIEGVDEVINERRVH
jgi:hypothetical protein